VLYEAEVCLGGGVITAALRDEKVVAPTKVGAQVSTAVH
jgi:hypothetical protein